MSKDPAKNASPERRGAIFCDSSKISGSASSHFFSLVPSFYSHPLFSPLVIENNRPYLLEKWYVIIACSLPHLSRSNNSGSNRLTIASPSTFAERNRRVSCGISHVLVASTHFNRQETINWILCFDAESATSAIRASPISTKFRFSAVFQCGR